jgi:hypothetical protein
MKKAEELPGRRPLWWWQTYRMGRGKMRHRSGSRVWCKKLVSRQRRRAEARDPENVPARFTRGWYD